MTCDATLGRAVVRPPEGSNPSRWCGWTSEPIPEAHRAANGEVMTMKCTCDDGSHDVGTALWHRAFCRWFDHREAGHPRRAAAWGWVADRIVRWA